MLMRPRDTFSVRWYGVQMHFLQPIKKFGTLAHETTRYHGKGVLKGPFSYIQSKDLFHSFIRKTFKVSSFVLVKASFN